MGSFFQNVWHWTSHAPSETWQWFNGLKPEEWLVTLVVVCAFGFLCLLGFGSRRI